ncbi:MAG: M14 family metallopeptidase [Acidobacteriota bacterium]|nr:M14 family metallopeptidase [Acidobacteriota bacterium]MDQ7087549.1 M14 family metallopeptidase [Acidobacteriota bacterium]
MGLPRSAAALALVLFSVAAAEPIRAPLPPQAPWHGASEALIVAADDPWITPAEASGFERSASLEAMGAWLERLARFSGKVRLLSLGDSPEGRSLTLVLASARGAADLRTLAAGGKPTLFVQAGIHAGEIDGKDAGLMLLRDLVVGDEQALLEQCNLLFLPVFNIDGHERRSAWSRINQRGPELMGWRTTARNLNLNRDYAKADSPEMHALLGLLARFPVDLYIDVHVTDGADYQYDITFGWNGAHAYSPAIAGWLDHRLAPAWNRALERAGHVPGPLIFLVDRLDPTQGIRGWTASPRYSHGYGDLRHLPTVLVENHSLKDFRRRVLGTRVLLAEAMRVLGAEGAALRRAVAADRDRRPAVLPLTWEEPASPPERITFLGVEPRVEVSPISGDRVVRWTGEPWRGEVPVRAATEPAIVVRRPAAYWVSAAWSDVIERLALHGVRFERLAEPRRVQVEMLRFGEPDFAGRPFEGRLRVGAPYTVERRRWTFPAGSVRVPTDQPLGDLAISLLEPEGPDSFFQWGFFPEIFQRTEYAEAYALEPLARRMLERDPEIRRRWEQALETDPALRGDPRRRLEWFYRRSPYYDQRHRLYPVARELP